jgi:hypothetical protein
MQELTLWLRSEGGQKEEEEEKGSHSLQQKSWNLGS